jgi:hypothetical protein
MQSYCSNSFDITKHKDIDKYVLKSSIPPFPDLRNYVKKSNLSPPPNLNNYIKKSDIPPCPKCPTPTICPTCPKCPTTSNTYPSTSSVQKNTDQYIPIGQYNKMKTFAKHEIQSLQKQLQSLQQQCSNTQSPISSLWKQLSQSKEHWTNVDPTIWN